MGVTKIRDNYWRARYTLKGETYNVGHFKTKKEAQAALDHDKLHREIGLEADDPAPIADFGEDAFQDPDSKEFAEGLPVREEGNPFAKNVWYESRWEKIKKGIKYALKRRD